MKNLLLVFCTTLSFGLFSQDIYEDVYNILQNKCMSCHDNATQDGNLDLEGFGIATAAKMADVYAKIYKTVPSDSTAAHRKNLLIYPGDPYKSFLYRKLDDGLTLGLSLHAMEGEEMPPSSSPVPSLTDKEKELIRQWIIYGAEETGTAFDKTLMERFYDDGGIESVPNPPVAPAEGEGFQIHLGPFYIAEGAEIEYFSKYETLLEDDLEIYKMKTEMGDFSHHFIAYKFSAVFGNSHPDSVPYGLRSVQDFDSREIVSVSQYSNTLDLPTGSAFEWYQNTVLDLNSHYINYSSTQVLKCEVFYNIYTQDLGTAAQTMEVVLVPETNIPIPNDNIPVTFTSNYQLGIDVNLYLWGIVAHTHQYGKDFNIYTKNLDGSRKEQIYDAGCANGLAGCNVEDFDYTHLPLRFYAPFKQVNLMEGVESEATYQNDGPNSVNWGFTSDDEMMIYVAFYVTDTTGVDMNAPEVEDTTVSIKEETNLNAAYPNPTSNILNLKVENKEISEVVIYDVLGKRASIPLDKLDFTLDVSSLKKGVYYYKIIYSDNGLSKGKFLKK